MRGERVEPTLVISCHWLPQAKKWRLVWTYPVGSHMESRHRYVDSTAPIGVIEAHEIVDAISDKIRQLPLW